MSGSRTQPHARFTARAASLRASTVKRRALLVGAILLALLLVWVLWFSPVLAVRSIQVSGAEGELARSVRAQADDRVGRPLLRVDTGDVAGRVEQLPAVRSVEVSRAWPNGLEVQVRPRTPVVVVDRGGERRLVDETGLAYAAASTKEAAQLPVVQLDRGRVSGSDIAAVARVMAAIPSKDRDQVSDLTLSRVGHVSFTLDGLRVAWGDSTRSKAKAQALTTMRPIAEKENSKRLDVSTPDRPVLI